MLPNCQPLVAHSLSSVELTKNQVNLIILLNVLVDVVTFPVGRTEGCLELVEYFVPQNEPCFLGSCLEISIHIEDSVLALPACAYLENYGVEDLVLEG